MIKKGHPYLSNENVFCIYRQIKGSSKGIEAFKADVIKVAYKGKKYWEYRDEEALFKIFQKHLEKELKNLKIDCFGSLMQYIS